MQKCEPGNEDLHGAYAECFGIGPGCFKASRTNSIEAGWDFVDETANGTEDIVTRRYILQYQTGIALSIAWALTQMLGFFLVWHVEAAVVLLKLR